MALVGIGVVAAVVFFFCAPIVYSPTKVYGPSVSLSGPQSYPTYPNWGSLSCSMLGVGTYYGRTVFQPNDACQFGRPSPAAYLP